MYCEPEQLKTEIAALKESGVVSEDLQTILDTLFMGVGARFGFTNYHWLEDHRQECWVWFMLNYTKIDFEKGSGFNYITTGVLNVLRQGKKSQRISLRIERQIKQLYQDSIGTVSLNALTTMSIEELVILAPPEEKQEVQPKRFIQRKPKGKQPELIEINEESHTVKEWCSIHNIKHSTVCGRIYRHGWSIVDAIITPVGETIHFKEPKQVLALPAPNPKQTRETFEYNGQRKTLWEWAKELEINYPALQLRLKRGWPIERILSTPSRNKLA